MDCTLHEYARNGNFQGCRYLISQGHDIDELNDKDESPLYLACLIGHQAIVKLLLEHGAILSDISYSNNDPLHVAMDYEDITKLLLEYGSGNQS